MKKCILVISLFYFLVGCSHITLVPSYDDEIAKQIVETAKMNDKIYLEMLSVPEGADQADKRKYVNYKEEYMNVELEIHSILFKNQARKKNEEMIKVIQILETIFETSRDEHKNASGVINDKKINDWQNQAGRSWKNLYRAEKGLPHETN